MKLYVRSNLSKVNHHPIFKSSRRIVLCQIVDFQNFLGTVKWASEWRGIQRGRLVALKESPAAAKGPHWKKRPVVAAEVIHLLIALMCHFFLFFFEVMLQAETGRQRQRAQEREWEGGRGGVFQILACGQTIFPLGGVGPIQSDLNSPTLKYLVNEWEKAPSQNGKGGVSTQCGGPPSLFLMILIKELGRENTVHEARHCVEMRGLGGVGEALIWMHPQSSEIYTWPIDGGQKAFNMAVLCTDCVNTLSVQ